MSVPSDPRLLRRLSVFSSAASVFSMAVGLIALAGWAFHLEVLKNWSVGPQTIKANTAICLVLLGIALWLLRKGRDDGQKTLFARIAAAIVILLALLSLSEFWFGWDLGIDQLLFSAPRGEEIVLFHPGLMSPITAADFLLLGLALLLLDWKTRRDDWPAQFLCLGAALGAAFGLVALVLEPNSSHTSMALPTAVTFFVLACGLVCSRATWAIGGLLTSQSTGARLLLRVVPAALLVLSLMGWWLSKPLLTEAHFTWVEVSVIAVLASTMLAGFIAWTAFIVDRSDRERRKAEEALQLSKAQVDLLLERFDDRPVDGALRRRVRIGFIAAVLLTGLLGFSTCQSRKRASNQADLVGHTYAVMGTLEATVKDVIDAETGARGFALTGQEQFLEPFASAQSDMPQDLARLRRLTADNARQQERTDVLEAEVSAAMGIATALVTTRRNTGTLPDLSLVQDNKKRVDAVRATIQEMEDEESRLLVQRTQKTAAARRLTDLLMLLGTLVALALLVLAGVAISREVGVSIRARAEIHALNTQLEQRVEQRTAAQQSEAAARMETEAQLRASEEMFRLLLDGIKDYAVYMLDPEGRVATWNSGAVRIKGYHAEEIIGKHVSCFYTDTDRDRNDPQAALREAAYSGRFEGQGWRVRKDGSKFWANAVITPVYEANGALKGYSKVVRDITERKQAEDELHKQAALLDLAHDAIIVRDLQSRVVFWNRGAQHIYGWSAAEVSGRVTHDLLQTKFPVPLAAIEAVLARKGEWEGELRHMTRHATEVAVASRWSLQRDERGAPAAILEINRDITDRKQAEAALRESQERQAGIIGSAMDAIISVDNEQRIVLFNAAAEKMFLCPQAEALGQPIQRFIPQRFQAAHAGHIRKFGETGVTNRAMGAMGPLWAVRADGQEFQIEASISQIVTGGKKLFTVILRDATERVQAERALREIQDRMTGIIASAMDSIITVDVQQRIVLFNAAAEKMFRCPATEALGQSIDRFVPQRFRSAHSTHIRQFAETGVTGRAMGELGALWALRADGEEFQIEASISQIEAAGKKLFTVILRDVTERKRAEEALREQAQLLDSAQVFVRDMESRVVFWPRGAEKLYGFTPQEALGIVSHDLFHTQFPEPLEMVEKKLFETGNWEGELIHRKRDGSIIVVASAWVLHGNSEGQPIRILETNTDITARKQAEERLVRQAEELARQAEELARSRQTLETQTLMLQSVLDSMAEGLVTADEQGNFVLWNPAAERILGMGAANLPSQEWTEHYGLYLADTVTPFPTDQLPLVRALRGEPSTAEMFVRNPELAAGVWIEVSGGPLKDKEGRVRGGVVAFRDITQRRAAEREIRKLNDELEERVMQRTAQLEAANKELEAFTYSVSHDLRAPLRHIAGFSGILLEEYGPGLDPQAQSYLNRIQEGTRKMGNLVDELLSLARVGRQSLSLQATGLDSIIKEVVSLLRPETEGRQIEWKIASLPFVECDPALMRQVLQNLISNALKYSRTRQRSVIEIGQTEVNGQPAIFIRDNGVGFSMKYADKLFGVFQRLHRAEDFEGTGVGLATVQRIIQKHGGRVWAEAELDKGATFYFSLGASQPTELRSTTAMVGA